MSGEAILSAENSGKPLGGQGETRRGNSRRSLDPLAGGEGLAGPPQESHPRSIFRFSVLRSRPQ